MVSESLIVLPTNNEVLGLPDGLVKVGLFVFCKHIKLQIAPLSFLGNVDCRCPIRHSPTVLRDYSPMLSLPNCLESLHHAEYVLEVDTPQLFGMIVCSCLDVFPII